MLSLRHLCLFVSRQDLNTTGTSVHRSVRQLSTYVCTKRENNFIVSMNIPLGHFLLTILNGKCTCYIMVLMVFSLLITS
jgi:hypothetical protein